MKIPHPDSPGWIPVPPPSCTPTQRFWLLRPGALTAGLRQLGTMSLRVLAEYPQAARADEAHALRLDRGTPVWVREVMMSIDGLDCVVARSLTPMRASRSTWQGMRRLRTRPLADMLYHDRTVRRSAFECRRLAPGVPFHAIARDAVTDPGASPADAGTRPAAETPHDVGRILARRSVFWRHGQPLLVAEGFLPGFWDKAGTRCAP